MSSATALASGVLVTAGTAVTVLAALAALRPAPVYVRLRYPTVVTSLGTPLAGLGVAVANGIGLTTAMVLLIVVLLAVCGPVLGAAIGRLNAQRDDATGQESPK